MTPIDINSGVGTRNLRVWIEQNGVHLVCMAVLVLSGCGSDNTQSQETPRNQQTPMVSMAELFAGNPLYAEPMDRPVDGQGLRDNPPLGWTSLLFVGEKLVTDTQREIWYTDLAVGSPTIKRIAGREDSPSEIINSGACPDARFPNITGLSLKSDGSLVGVSATTQSGNAIFVVQDPFGPNCTVTFLAGPTVGGFVNFGDVDGSGATAHFQYVEWPAVIDDNIYVIDSLNHKIKRIANDATHTVTTITTLPADKYSGHHEAMIALNGKLYIVGNTAIEGYIGEIDPATGVLRDVIRGGPETFGDTRGFRLTGLATDGNGLFTHNRGHLLYVTFDGKVANIAGDGTYIEFGPSYNPARPQTAESVQLVALGRAVFLTFHDNAVYFSAKVQTDYVERIEIK